MKAHWNTRYQQTEQPKLGWYESKSEPSLSLIQSCDLPKDALIADIGSGSSVLIDDLIESGYTNLIATDISESGLAITRNRLGKKTAHVRFIADDLTHPTELLTLTDVALWHDRAALHFFTQEKDRDRYLRLVKSILKPNGYVIISTFAIEGLTKCSGLEIQQYSPKTMSQFLGKEFKPIRSLKHVYTTTWGQERPFIYCVFQRRFQV